MRREALFLADIVGAVDSTQQFLEDVSRADFLQDDLVRSAVLQKLAIIGEAAARLSKEFQARHQEIEWADIIGFRNIAVHAYFSVDWSIVWITATNDVPDMKPLIAAILAEEYPDTR